MTMERVEFPTYETLLTEAIRSLAVDSGTVTTRAPVGTNILQDTTKSWAADVHKNRLVKIIRGFGAGQTAVVESNTTKSLVIKGSWVAALDTTSVYQILDDPKVITERAISKTIRDITPGAVGTFWLPETGHIDLSKYLASSWGIYAPTTATMVINCYLNISHDGGTTWRRAAGYEILDADFVRAEWNTIDCPLKLAEAKLEVVIATAYPAELDLMCIAKP